MKRADIDNLRLGESQTRDVVPVNATDVAVIGLPPHLRAEIVGGNAGYQFRLLRGGDTHSYTQDRFSPTPEDSLEELKKLLKWDPMDS